MASVVLDSHSSSRLLRIRLRATAKAALARSRRCKEGAAVSDVIEGGQSLSPALDRMLRAAALVSRRGQQRAADGVAQERPPRPAREPEPGTSHCLARGRRGSARANRVIPAAVPLCASWRRVPMPMDAARVLKARPPTLLSQRCVIDILSQQHRPAQTRPAQPSQCSREPPWVDCRRQTADGRR